MHSLSRPAQLVGLLMGVVSGFAVGPSAHAQRRRSREPAPTPAATEAPAAQPEPADDGALERAGARQAYDRATAAFLARDYERASALFETAYRLAPSPAALVQAMRSHERGGNLPRALTLAALAMERHQDDATARRQAERILGEHAAEFVRVESSCSAECTLEVDGALSEQRVFFVPAGRAVRVHAAFETGALDETVEAAAGETRTLTFTAPVAEAPTAPAEAAEGDPGPPPPSGGGISPGFFTVGLVLTIAAGATLVWSAVDTLDGVPEYEANPTREALREGQQRELRTNILIGVTGGLALATALFAAFTDWGSSAAASSDDTVSLRVLPIVDALGQGGGVTVVGVYR